MDAMDKYKCMCLISVVIISLIVLLVSAGKTIRYAWEMRRGVLLLGLSDAGKSQIFAQLMNLYNRETPSSLQEEIGEYITHHGCQLGIVDLPGQDGLRERYFNIYKKCARAIVFVIDSVTIHENVSKVVDFLYTVLLDPEIRFNNLPILIVCNKQDVPRAMDHISIRIMLEKEMTVVRRRTVSFTKMYNPDVTEFAVYLGKFNEDFKFHHLNCRVDIVDCSALPTDNFFSYMVDVKDWIGRLNELYIYPVTR